MIFIERGGCSLGQKPLLLQGSMSELIGKSRSLTAVPDRNRRDRVRDDRAFVRVTPLPCAVLTAVAHPKTGAYPNAASASTMLG